MEFRLVAGVPGGLFGFMLNVQHQQELMVLSLWLLTHDARVQFLCALYLIYCCKHMMMLNWEFKYTHWSVLCWEGRSEMSCTVQCCTVLYGSTLYGPV